MKDRLSDAAHYSATEDPDAVEFAAWCATSHWRSTLAPFVDVGFQHLGNDAVRIGAQVLDQSATFGGQRERDSRRRGLSPAGRAKLDRIIADMLAAQEWELDCVAHVAAGWSG